jgi:molybdenum cofactor cytidylyltransferase
MIAARSRTPAGVALALLAAGGSSRMGRPKALLTRDGVSFVAHLAREALAAGCGRTLVVTGSSAPLVEQQIRELPVEVVRNRAWSDGMSGSLRLAVETVAGDPRIEAIGFLLVDQPEVGAPLLREVADLWCRSGAEIAAAGCSWGAGVPAIFGRGTFAELLALRGDRGARSVIARDAARVAVLQLAADLSDLDTPDDLAAGDSRYSYPRG